jgi:hypothetical protein
MPPKVYPMRKDHYPMRDPSVIFQFCKASFATDTTDRSVFASRTLKNRDNNLLLRIIQQLFQSKIGQGVHRIQENLIAIEVNDQQN